MNEDTQSQQIDAESCTESWYTNIAKTPEEAEREYDKLSGSYDQVLAARDYRPPEDASNLLAELIDPAGTGRILEAGCGTGLIGAKLHEKGFKDITGMDISANCLKEAESKNAYTGTVKQNILEPLPFAERSFDAVVCVAVFSRFDDQQIMAILKEFARITRQGGIILFSHRTDLLESSSILEKIEESDYLHLKFSSDPYKYIPGDEHYKDIFVRYFALEVTA